MTRKILRQIWNERKQNTWLFLELIVASLFLWLAIDPLYTLVCRNNIDKGYEPKRLYRLIDTNYRYYEPQYISGIDPLKSREELIKKVANAFDNVPEIESYFIGAATIYPNSGSYSSASIAKEEENIPDSLRRVFKVRTYDVVVNEKSRFFKTFGILDANTGKILKQSDNPDKNDIFLSRRAAVSLFGTTDVVGKRVETGSHNKLRINGVFEDIQLNNYSEYNPALIYVHKNNRNNNFGDNISFRLKNGVDEYEFYKRFKAEIAPGLTHENFYVSDMKSFEDMIEEHNKECNIPNKYRMYAGLSGFALFCAFMGVFSSFWIRTNNRRRDIGIMRSMGASRHAIIGQFVAEALLLVSVAFLVGMIITGNYIHINGFAEPLAKVIVKMHDEMPDQSYLHNRAVPHIAIVTAIAYICICVIAIAGVLIPATRLTRSLPADALRE